MAASSDHLAPVIYLPGVPAPGSVEHLRDRIREVESSPTPRASRSRLGTDVAEEELPESVGERSARVHTIALRALTRRSLSIAEMRSLLATREIDEVDREIEVDALVRVGLLDDDDLASTLVRSLRERKGLGRAAIVAELKRRKIDPDSITAALDDVSEEGDEFERALEVALKRAGQLRSLDPETAKRRLSGYLMRKGYSGSVMSRAVGEALGAGGSRRTAGGPRFD
ncbi:regulatory protein RecX [Galbitalea soli]|uniref:Regulatory protein RecX n=1 Tax=Galbitalea soli TaxID=1268042 RepID=A0A7C9TMV3_9MICO|nr:regulatory protein RecX [Galbitalea soli]NEM89878.1 regulatory protein RecX [Galbitalea soli]NYJ30582.1 SOS response regulatory protein OraA/RecX [Galbitalea soli]